jgi:hypothetical protein
VVLAEATGGDMLWLKDAALLIFFALFVGVVLRLILGGRQRYEKTGLIPLTDDVVEPRDEQ